MAGERDGIRDGHDDRTAPSGSGPPRRESQAQFGEPRSVELWLNQFEWESAARDRAARERDLLAAGRDRVAAARADAAATRHVAAATRHSAAGTRARAARLRTHPIQAGVPGGADGASAGTGPVDEPLGRGGRADRAADERDRAADRSDRSIARRERAAERHDFDRLVWLAGDDLWERLVQVLLERADRRDQLAELRDRGAEERDQVAAHREYNAADARRDRMAAVADRIASAQDRDAAAEDRADLIAAVRDLLEFARGREFARGSDKRR
jgi:hypothetical protein